jgi:phosphoribosylanthranilate isomerase
VTRVKICGLRSVEHAQVAVEAGADLIGFVFYPPVRRYVEPAAAAAIVRALPRDRVATVGIFVDESPVRMAEIADLVGLDYLQLGGAESSDLNRTLARPVIRTVHVGPATTPSEIGLRSDGARLIHLDTMRLGQYGGTGESFDWSVARAAGVYGAVLLAGGLRSENVAAAIAIGRPWGVDVSSGVESDGIKDAAKIEAFIAAARQADVTVTAEGAPRE